MQAIFAHDYYGRPDKNNLSDHMLSRLNAFLETNKDAVLDLAAKYLAEKMSRMKVVKDRAKVVAEG